MNKIELIKMIKEMPDDIDIFVSKGEHNDINIKIFIEPKEEAFYGWYFGL